MGKGVFPHDCLVELNREAGHRCHTPRQVHDLGGIDIRVKRHDVAAHFHRHDDFFQSCVACAFTKAIDRAFDLTGPAGHCGQRIGGRHAKVVVTMRGKDDVLGPWDF